MVEPKRRDPTTNHFRVRFQTNFAAFTFAEITVIEFIKAMLYVPACCE